MDVFVTGGSGFVGRHLIETLVRQGDTVRALVRSEAAAERVRQAGATAVRADMLDSAAMAQGMADCEIVYHSAAHFALWGDYDTFARVNVEGTIRLLEASRAAHIRCFVQVGAASVVMGPPAAIEDADEMWPLREAAYLPYSTTKGRSEQLVRAANTTSMRTVVVRPPLIWGSDAPVLADVAAQAQQGKFRWLDGGRYACSTCHIDNVCHALQLAARKGQGGQAYIVTDDATISFRDFTEQVLRAYGITRSAPSVPFRAAWTGAGVLENVWRRLHLQGTPPLTRELVRMIGRPFTLNIAKVKRELGYQPLISVAEGIAQIAAANKA